MPPSIAARLVVIAVAMAAAACSSDGDGSRVPDPAAARKAIALNNRGVELLRQGAQEHQRGDTDTARVAFRAALTCFEDAIRRRADYDTRGYDRAWANKSYALWRMDRLDESAAAAAETRRINPSYEFNPLFVDKMTAAGHPIAPPSPGSAK